MRENSLNVLDKGHFAFRSSYQSKQDFAFRITHFAFRVSHFAFRISHFALSFGAISHFARSFSRQFRISHLSEYISSALWPTQPLVIDSPLG